MNQRGFDIPETRTKRKTAAHMQHKPKTEFSKGLIKFLCTLCGGTWVVATVSWFMWREFPHELVQYTSWFFGAVIAYYAKSCYENRAKIDKGVTTNES